MPLPVKPETYHHGNLSAALIEAALALIMEKGAGALTIREVASRAGVSHAAPYRHFADKSALMAELARQGFDLMVAQMRRRMAAFPKDPLMRLKYCGIGYIEFALAHPAHYRVMFGPWQDQKSTPEALKVSSSASFQTLVDAITACQAKGTVHGGDPMAKALSAWSMVHGFAMLVIDGLVHERAFGQALPAMMEGVVDSLYFGFGPGNQG
ncbi:MAG: TetR/AcrR family transcriptional regulator [Desulfobacterales bacterium]|nr:TetR/AcrR family transcriptional regulator [Desulfobacterales bacterium]MBI5895260.1 TetR/AcrR family transcriptional regulator [Desulfobacterales bacterium]